MEVPATSYQEASNVWGQYHLKRILERPVVLKQSTWTTTDPAVPMHVLFTDYEVGTIHYKDEFLFPESIISSSRQVREKLNNYQYMRANVRVTVRVNSTPFQQGQLMLVYTPYSYYTTRFRSQANECLPSLSTFPHVKLDLRETSEAEIKVPFASVFDSYNLGDDTNPFGSMRIYVVVPVKGATDAETVTYTVSANFEDIELSVPTSRGLSTNTRYAQSDNRTKMPAEKKKGPVEKISTVVAEATGAIGSLGIPGLSLGATVVSWIARCMSGLSAVFGWSKPLITETAVPFIHTPARYMMNGEGPEESQSLSMIPDNAVHVRGVVPEDKDEMALDYIFSKDYIFSQTTIAQANTNSRKLLFTHPVSPFQPGYTSGIAPSQLCTNAMGFATLLYQNWRGDLTFKYDIVRTNFHAGRLMAVFFPETSWLDVPESLSEEMTDNLNTVYQLNAPLDQQKENEFIFTVPYISNQPYKRTCRVAEGQFDTATMETATGAVGVYAFNDMVIPETCAQEVTLIAYIQAGSNFEVAKAFPQITPGFAPAAPPLDIAQEIADGLNTMFDGDFEPVTPGSVNLSLRDLLTNGGLTKWVSDSSFSSSIPGLLGTGTLYPDGTFDADVDIVFTNSNFTVSNPVTVTITCLGGSVTAASANKGLENLNSVSETSTWVVTPSTIQKLAQSDNTSVIATTQNNDVRLATVGEYSLSLRNYIKRFGKVFSLDDFITYRPSYGSSTSSDSTNAGKRTLEFQEDDTGAFIPETPLSLVSYLYRFWGGSTMLKCHLSRRTKATCSLDLSTSAQAAKTKLDYPTPQIFQAGYINNSLSVQIPYYSSLRANVVGGTSGSDLARATIEFDTNLNAEAVYEAAGDDFSYFFLVGPPVMRPISNSPPAPVLTTQNV